MMQESDIFPQALAVRQDSSQTCYFPDKSVAKGYEPCGTGPNCCNLDEGEECLDTNLCGRNDKNDTQSFYRGACANKDWFACTGVCAKKNTNDTAPVKRCGSKDYCCENPSKDCCDFATDRFTIEILPNTKPPGPSLQPDPPKPPVGAIIGGVVGGLVFVSILSIIGCCLFRRRRAAKRKLLEGEVEDKSKTGFDPSLAEADASPNSVLVESDARAIKPKTIHELPG